jgi:hypothetical protein
VASHSRSGHSRTIGGKCAGHRAIASKVPVSHPPMLSNVSLCLGQNFTPCRFWMDMIRQIRQDGLVTDCAILVDWAQVASTLSPVNANGEPMVPLAIKELRVPLADN